MKYIAPVEASSKEEDTPRYSRSAYLAVGLLEQTFPLALSDQGQGRNKTTCNRGPPDLKIWHKHVQQRLLI